MNRYWFLLILGASTSAHSANYATCILDRAKDAQNDAVAVAAYRICKEKYPGGIEAVSQGSGRGFMAFSNGAECVLSTAKNTTSPVAGRIIFAACRKLYDESGPPNE